MFVLLVFALLLIPAAVVCWPQPYAQLISLPNCSGTVIESKPFTPVPFPRGTISFNPDNAKYAVRVFYRSGPQGGRRACRRRIEGEK